MRQQIPLMLDSTVLKQVPRLDSSLFKQLIQYLNVGIFKLYISEIVEREYLSWIQQEAQNSFDKIIKARASLDKYYREPEIMGFSISFSTTGMIAQTEINKLLINVQANWNNFKDVSNITVLPIEPSHTKFVLDAYFTGDTPFKTPKNREDFPDAFIFCSLVELLKKHEQVLFITQDNNFRKKVSRDNLICFNNLASLLFDSEYKIQNDFFTNLEDDDKAISLVGYFSEYIEKKASREIEFSDYIEDINLEISEIAVGDSVEVTSSIKEILFDTDKLNLISKNSYLLSFSAELVHLISSTSNKEELALIEQERANKLEREVLDDGTFNISETVINTFRGNISIEFADSDPTSWKEKKSDVIWKTSKFEEIDLSLEDIRLD